VAVSYARGTAEGLVEVTRANCDAQARALCGGKLTFDERVVVYRVAFPAESTLVEVAVTRANWDSQARAFQVDLGHPSRLSSTLSSKVN